VPVADRADLLPGDVPPARPGRADPAVLDQHGGDGHLHPRRGVAGGRRPWVRAPGRIAAVREGADADVLGDGNLVAAAVGDARGVAARGQGVPARLRPRVLGGSVPAGDVRGLYPPSRAGVRPPVPDPAGRGVRLGVPGCVDGHRRRLGPPRGTPSRPGRTRPYWPRNRGLTGRLESRFPPGWGPTLPSGHDYRRTEAIPE